MKLAVYWMLFAAEAFAQSGTGVVTGKISVPATVAMGVASVQLTNEESGAVYKAASSPAGDFQLAAVPVGKYELTVSMLGLKTYQRKGIVIEAAQVLRLDIALEEARQLSTLGEDPASLTAEFEKPPPSGPTPRMPDGKPDLSGVWRRARVIDPGKPELLPWAEALMKQRAENNSKDNPSARCLPESLLKNPPMSRFAQTASILVMIIEDEVPGSRVVFLDGRSHPKDMDPTWTGHSTGKWEGETLVVDRAGFNDKTWLDGDGRPHTEMLHIVDRYRRPDLGHLEIQTTIEDPGALAKPWTLRKVADLAPAGDEVIEFICAENNKDVEHMVGK